MSPPSGFPSAPDRNEVMRHAGVFLEMVELATAGDVEAANTLIMGYLYPDGAAPFTDELHCRYLAVVGPLLTAAFMDKPDARLSSTWTRITACPSAATRPERDAVRTIAAHRAGDDETSRSAQSKLFDDCGYKDLLQMVLVVLRICVEVTPPA